MQGIGEVLRENLVYDSAGRLQTRALMDYVLPGPSDAPEEFKLFHMETPTSFNPFGIRGVGEGGKVIYTDGDKKRAEQAQKYFDRAGVRKQIDVHHP